MIPEPMRFLYVGCLAGAQYKKLDGVWWVIYSDRRSRSRVSLYLGDSLVTLLNKHGLLQ